MVSLRDITIRRDKEQAKKQDIRGRYRAVLTDAEGNQTSTDPQTDVWANRTTRRVWHMPLGATQPSQVFCLNISNPYVGLPVECGYEESNNTVEVLRVDQLPAKYGESPIGWDQNDPASFEPGGLKMMWLYSKALIPLATWPDDTGLVVNINAGDYPYLGSRKTFTGQTGYTLAAPAGAGTHYYAGLYLDAANLLQVVYGTAVATSSTPPEPAWPAGAFRLSVVRVANGQASIVFGSDNSADNDVFDRRMLWSDEIAGSAGGWPFANILTVSAADPDAQYTTIPDAITAAADGGTILVDAETFSISTTITVNKAVTITSLGQTVITSSVAGPTFELTDAAGATLENLIIRNTGAGAKSGCIKWAVDNVIIRDCLLEKLSGASTVSYCLWQAGGFDAHIIDTNAECTDPPGSNYAYLNDTADAGVTITRGNLAGLTSEVFTARAGSNLIGEFFSANIVDWAGTSSGWYFDSGALAALDQSAPNIIGGIVDGYAPIRLKNTSGATANANEVGYIDSAGEYKTTTTANLIAAWCVVIVGGANNADIYVVRRGRVTVEYAGSDPSAGHFLTTNTTAGSAQRRTVMHPAIFAVCTAAGSGGLVEALLLTGRELQPSTDTHYIYGVDGASDSDFTSTIATLPGGAVLTYGAVTTGNENTIVPWAALDAAFNAKLVLWNLTRGTSALISAVVAGTNTITLTATVPAGWTVGDTITARGQTNTANWSGGSYYFEWDMSGWAAKPALATAIVIENAIYDASTTIAALSSFHPFETFVSSKNFQRWTQAGNATARFLSSVTVTVFENKFTFGWDASGSGTTTIFGVLAGWIVAVP